MGSGIGIVAGKGALPRLIAEHCQKSEKPYQVIQFDGVELDWLDGHSVINAQFEQPKKLLKALAKAGCSELTFAGGMIRPQLKPLKFDTKFLSLAPKLLPALKGGDDAALRVITDFFEAEGFSLLGAHDVLSELLLPVGVHSVLRPSAQDEADAARAAIIHRAMSVADVGQSVVVAQGLALGIESQQGTDAMLRFVADTRHGLSPDPDGAKGLLFKAPKLDQDWKIDLPLIGPDTIERASQAGLAGIVVQAGGVMVLDGTVEAVDRAGLFLWARSHDTPA